MTTIFNTSFLSSPEQFESAVSKKGYRSSKYNVFVVDVVDFDNEVYTYTLEADSEAHAAEMAQEAAQVEGVMISFCNVYKSL